MKLLVILSAILNSAPAQTVPTGSWGIKSPNVGSNMRYGASASDGRYLYYWGGTGVAPANQEMNRYDPVSDTWWVSPNLLPNVVTRPGHGAHYGGYLYSFGNSQTAYSGQILRYTISADSWTTIAAAGVSTPHTSDVAVAPLGSYIYLAGGVSFSTAFTRFDPSDNSLTSLDPVPVGSQGAAMVAVAFTGRLYFTYQASIYEYDVATSGWTQMTSAPLSRTFHQAVANTDGRIYLFGGNGQYRCDEYNPLLEGSGSSPWNQRASLNYTHTNHPGGGLIGGKIYCCGGQSNPTTCEEFTPPDFGSAPSVPANAVQIGSLGVTPEAGVDPDLGWTDSGISFQADLSDPDAGQNVQFVVQVKAASDTWSLATTLSSMSGAQGTHTIDHAIPAGGSYHWRYRAVDAFGNVAPAPGGIPGWIEFETPGTAGDADFRSDQAAPSEPVMIFPIDQDVLVPSLIAGDVTFVWAGSTDDGPLSALRYTIEVAHNDPAFGIPAAGSTAINATQATFTLAVSRYNYYWRVGATDIGGNFSGLPMNGSAFRVVGDDGLDHGSGDAARACGFGAGVLPGRGLLILAVLIGAAALARRK